MQTTTVISSPFTIGIDVGTTSVKAVAVDDAGNVLALETSHHGIDQSADGVQVDPSLWWSSLVTAVRALSDTVDLTKAQAVGFSGNMSSVVLIDETMSSVAPALLLADTRGGEQLEALPSDVHEKISRATENNTSTVFALSSLLWWQATDPGALERATAWVSAKDFLRAQLTGVVATDPTDAYNSLLLVPDTSNQNATFVWNDELITELRLPRAKFPALLESGSTAGEITDSAAQHLGIPSGIPVATGAGDVASSLAGMGGLPNDALAINLGTSAVLMAPLSRNARPRANGARMDGMTMHPATDGSWFALGSLLTGGLALNWLRTLTGEIPSDLQPTEPDPDDRTVFLPYLAGTGSPDFDGSATGTIIGITPSTTADQLFRAVFEAVCFDISELVDDLGRRHYSHVVICGGGAKISAWPQMFADILGMDVSILDQPDLSAVGAAVLGWQASGQIVTPRTIVNTVEPNIGTKDAWDARRSRYRRTRRRVLSMTTQFATEEKEHSES